MSGPVLALPLYLEGCHIRDGNGESIALLGGSMAEYRVRGATIVAAVNGVRMIGRNADLIEAAKAALPYLSPAKEIELQAAIAAAEEQI